MPIEEVIKAQLMSRHLNGRFPGLTGVLFACGLTCALAIAITAAGRRAAPGTAQTSPSPPRDRDRRLQGGAAAPRSSRKPDRPEASSGEAARPAKRQPPEKKRRRRLDAQQPLRARLRAQLEHGPIDITSDTMDLDYKAHVVLFAATSTPRRAAALSPATPCKCQMTRISARFSRSSRPATSA